MIELAILGFVTSLFSALCAGLGIWLVIGRTPLIIRLLATFAAFGTLGLVFSKVQGGRQEDVLGLVCLAQFVALVLVAVQGTTRWRIAAVCVCSLLGYLAWDFDWQSEFYRSPVFSLFVLAMLIFVTVIVLAQFIWGVRILRLLDTMSEIELESATGKSWTQWQRYLDERGCDQMNHGQIVYELRIFGLRYELIKVITTAYLRSCGRSETGVERSTDTSNRFAILRPRFTRGEGIRMTRQFSIGQLLVVTIVAAGLFRIALALSIDIADSNEITVLVPLTISFAAISLLVIWTRLATRAALVSTVYTWVAAALLILVSTPLLFVQVPEELALFHLLGYAIWLSLGTSLIRGSGYRVVTFHKPTKSEMVV